MHQPAVILNKKLSDDFQAEPGGQFQKSRRTIKSPKLANYLFCYDNIQSIYDIIKDDPISSKNSWQRTNVKLIKIKIFEFKWLSSEKWQAAIVKVCQFWDEYLMNADLDQIGRQQEINTECTRCEVTCRADNNTRSWSLWPRPVWYKRQSPTQGWHC